jgi:hypothetical protein
MKITKRQLRRIINEARRPMSTEADELEFAMDEYLKARVQDGEDDPSRLHREMVAIADQLLDDASAGGVIDTSRWQQDPSTGKLT